MARRIGHQFLARSPPCFGYVLGGKMENIGVRLRLGGALVCLLTLLLPASPMAAGLKDATADTLDRCLDEPANGSTAGQTDCEATASSDYDRRMNAAYATLLRKLPRQAAQNLRLSQRAWLAFHDSEAKTRGALYETRQGTMYVPMQAADATNIIRDRALQLEGYVRVMAIEDAE
ncbi:DUF1311 domain-containing protein [Mesorhizobium sp. CO1-1-11]|nr:DUF1311 domain-containing protein [Mesorhizobium sp. CO1-1-11]